MMHFELANRAVQTIQELAKVAHDNAQENGFYAAHERLLTDLKYEGCFDSAHTAECEFALAQIALITSECSKAVAEICRRGAPETIGEELADIIIRTLDLSATLGINIGREVVDKMETNELRDCLHGQVM